MSREIIAILRGVTPDAVLPIGEALVTAGIDVIEVPLNSPDPLQSIETLAKGLAGRARIGAGTVLTTADVDAVHAAGGTLIVSPDCNPDVIDRTKALGMASYPGVATPTECFTALRHGADGLKFFPALLLGTKGLSAIKAVLPPAAKTYAVGGVGPSDFADWFGAGVTGFGMGTGVYKPGMSAAEVSARAQEIVAAYDAAKA
ncbi:2-dehydro-3-deoxy-6-phosphogalactonate aldolase [Sagittula sp. SSi028]|uniref:2-dehydro-3-deoxy-6-phosphogalactonate aldolase n=1 Tax=Sagittula sp. SSi028 TaxID=3400636 RepID=UPI003AF43F88